MKLVCLCGKELPIELILGSYASVKCDRCKRLWLVEMVLAPKIILDPELKLVENNGYEIVP